MALTLTYQKSNMNEEFLGNAIHHLTEALLDSRVIGDPIASMQELQLAAVFANVVLEFLRGKPYADTSSALANVLSEAERPSLDISTTYFSDGVQLADRLVSILSVALDNKEDSDIVQDCYGVILEASLHSRSVWEAFLKHADMPRLHQSLLLEDPRRTLRENIAQKIASVCGGDLPSTCPVTKGEIATHFWTTIVIVLSEAIRYPTQSQQLFGIAEHVFRVKDEYDHTEELLKSSLTQWSGLLLSHKHQEFVGRDETDFVVVGFTKLLLCCILSLKSFKKPINAGNLMIQIFKKYIFTVRYVVRPCDYSSVLSECCPRPFAISFI
jgi:ubiquitin carboxyl-terminal hydrolase 34